MATTTLPKGTYISYRVRGARTTGKLLWAQDVEILRETEEGQLVEGQLAGRRARFLVPPAPKPIELRCQECGRKVAKGRRSCSNCRSTDVDLA
jgi:hypothetical protein